MPNALTEPTASTPASSHPPVYNDLGMSMDHTGEEHQRLQSPQPRPTSCSVSTTQPSVCSNSDVIMDSTTPARETTSPADDKDSFETAQSSSTTLAESESVHQKVMVKCDQGPKTVTGDVDLDSQALEDLNREYYAAHFANGLLTNTQFEILTLILPAAVAIKKITTLPDSHKHQHQHRLTDRDIRLAIHYFRFFQLRSAPPLSQFFNTLDDELFSELHTYTLSKATKDMLSRKWIRIDMVETGKVALRNYLRKVEKRRGGVGEGRRREMAKGKGLSSCPIVEAYVLGA
ncbi:hypothetical protein BDV96DRAFT_584063 [Lophiotrema nucula]|uniref:Uncharacterized protein n=1 Tax=Lophiotrema nucula TaxID=690887 RepID=A0A6A5YVB8_9PLEO|nr:hypothetical protein BDV96DRAFT_584063 [Lophiotrema nucula]